MKPIRQTITETGRGNCFSACVASMLEIECDSVPNINSLGDGWFYKFNDWLIKEHGYALLMHVPGTYYLPDGIPFIASVDSPRGPIRHAVIMAHRGFEAVLLHDPYPEDTPGWTPNDPHYLYFLVPKDGSKLRSAQEDSARLDLLSEKLEVQMCWSAAEDDTNTLKRAENLRRAIDAYIAEKKPKSAL